MILICRTENNVQAKGVWALRTREIGPNQANKEDHSGSFFFLYVVMGAVCVVLVLSKQLLRRHQIEETVLPFSLSFVNGETWQAACKERQKVCQKLIEFDYKIVFPNSQICLDTKHRYRS